MILELFIEFSVMLPLGHADEPIFLKERKKNFRAGSGAVVAKVLALLPASEALW